MTKDKLRVVIIISPDIQDKYLASNILDEFNVVGIFIEPQYRTVSAVENAAKKISKLSLKDTVNIYGLGKKILDKIYFRNYEKRVSEIFHKSFYNKGEIIDSYNGCPVYRTKLRDISSPENVMLLKELKPDVIAACGCSILRENLLEVPPLGTINLHSGIAPRYRGCSCYFWALYNNEPEYVGVTVHYVTPGIDDGDIIHQGRPELVDDDNEIKIFVKLMEVGTQLMIKSLHEIEDGTVKGYAQTEKGKLYLDNMTTVTHFRELHKKLRDGLIREYLANQNRRIAKARIIE